MLAAFNADELTDVCAVYCDDGLADSFDNLMADLRFNGLADA